MIHTKKSDEQLREELEFVISINVTELTRRETCGSKCKLFIEKHGQYRQGRAVANRYGMGKTQG